MNSPDCVIRIFGLRTNFLRYWEIGNSVIAGGGAAADATTSRAST